MAISFGPRLRDLRQRAASTSSAVESGPPDTARIRAECDDAKPKSNSASAAKTAPVSAVDTLLFPLDALPDACGRARIFAADLGERRARHFLLLHGIERLRKPQQRVGRLGVSRVLGREFEEGLRRGIILLALEQALAQPELSFRCAAVARILAEEAAEGLLGQRVVLAHHVTVAEIVSVLRRVGRRRNRRGHGARAAGIA